MEIVVLTEEKVEEYADYLTEDVAENISRTYYNGLIVEDDGSPVAGMVWEYRNVNSGESLESNICWLRVESEDAAKLMFERYGELVQDAEVKTSVFCLPAQTSKTEKQLLKDLGFSVVLSEGDRITATLSEIAAIGFVSKVKKNDAINPLRQISQRGLNGAIRRIMSLGHYGTCEDMNYLPRAYFENDVSCYSEDDGVINGLLLCHKTPSGKLEVVLLAVIGKETAKLLPQLIGTAVHYATENYPMDTEVIVNRHNDALLALGEKLFPEGFGIPMFTGSRAED